MLRFLSEQGTQDAHFEVAESWVQAYGVLDDVFASFLETNVHLGKRRSIEEMLTPDPIRRYYRYEHLRVPYLATTFTKYNYDNRWINIKLDCNGFTWPRPPHGSRRAPYTRHGADSWNVLPAGEFYDRVFPNIQDAFHDAYGVCFYYTEHAQRLDMKFFYDSDRTHVLLTFEMGSPYFERENDRACTSRRQFF